MDIQQRCNKCGALMHDNSCSFCKSTYGKKPKRSLREPKIREAKAKSAKTSIPRKSYKHVKSVVLAIIIILFVLTMCISPFVFLFRGLIIVEPLAQIGTLSNPQAVGSPFLLEGQSRRGLSGIELTVFRVIRGEEAQNLVFDLNPTYVSDNSTEYMFARIHVRYAGLFSPQQQTYKFTNTLGTSFLTSFRVFDPPSSSFGSTPSVVLLGGIVDKDEDILIFYENQLGTAWLRTE